eukprot:TRINITY_DN54970_c0_g1_i1.p1 TRINITY_DN54970_c0_g1~~TRINITY_DN54970_c0_g1_i1.p1  ORF type:complete len:1113 (-),score=81.87 TRINITY_DN54970_c0_g1_i1:81-3215(-)
MQHESLMGIVVNESGTCTAIDNAKDSYGVDFSARGQAMLTQKYCANHRLLEEFSIMPEITNETSDDIRALLIARLGLNAKEDWMKINSESRASRRRYKEAFLRMGISGPKLIQVGNIQVDSVDIEVRVDWAADACAGSQILCGVIHFLKGDLGLTLIDVMFAKRISIHGYEEDIRARIGRIAAKGQVIGTEQLETLRRFGATSGIKPEITETPELHDVRLLGENGFVSFGRHTVLAAYKIGIGSLIRSSIVGMLGDVVHIFTQIFGTVLRKMLLAGPVGYMFFGDALDPLEMSLKSCTSMSGTGSSSAGSVCLDAQLRLPSSMPSYGVLPQKLQIHTISLIRNASHPDDTEMSMSMSWKIRLDLQIFLERMTEQGFAEYQVDHVMEFLNLEVAKNSSKAGELHELSDALWKDFVSLKSPAVIPPPNPFELEWAWKKLVSQTEHNSRMGFLVATPCTICKLIKDSPLMVSFTDFSIEMDGELRQQRGSLVAELNMSSVKIFGLSIFSWSQDESTVSKNGSVMDEEPTKLWSNAFERIADDELRRKLQTSEVQDKLGHAPPERYHWRQVKSLGRRHIDIEASGAKTSITSNGKGGLEVKTVVPKVSSNSYRLSLVGIIRAAGLKQIVGSVISFITRKKLKRFISDLPPLNSFRMNLKICSPALQGEKLDRHRYLEMTVDNFDVSANFKEVANFVDHELARPPRQKTEGNADRGHQRFGEAWKQVRSKRDLKERSASMEEPIGWSTPFPAIPRLDTVLHSFSFRGSLSDDTAQDGLNMNGTVHLDFAAVCRSMLNDDGTFDYAHDVVAADIVTHGSGKMYEAIVSCGYLYFLPYDPHGPHHFRLYSIGTLRRRWETWVNLAWPQGGDSATGAELPKLEIVRSHDGSSVVYRIGGDSGGNYTIKADSALARAVDYELKKHEVVESMLQQEKWKQSDLWSPLDWPQKEHAFQWKGTGAYADAIDGLQSVACADLIAACEPYSQCGGVAMRRDSEAPSGVDCKHLSLYEATEAQTCQAGCENQSFLVKEFFAAPPERWGISEPARKLESL